MRLLRRSYRDHKFCTTSAKTGAGTIESIFDETIEGTEKLRNINASLKHNLQSNIYKSTLGNKSKLMASWNELISAIELESDYIQNNKESMIPIIDMKRISDCQSIHDVSQSFIGDMIRKVGVFIVTNVIDDNQVIEWKQELKEYIDVNVNINGHKLYGSPADNPQVYEIYWSKPQIKARQHPNMVKAIRFANHLWSFDADSDNVVDVPVMYVDRLRMRQPLDESFDFLGPHLDSGSIERWQDVNYRMCYDDIFKLQWKEWNGFNATNRINAQTDLYDTENCCTAFRSFQGWLSLSNISTGNGTLRVCPMLREAMSYIMLRPFVEDTNGQSLEAWNFGEIFGGFGLKLKEKYHKLLIDSMVSIPEVHPGDMVFWLCDTVHSVEQRNNSKTEDSSVFYIPSCFDCDVNSKFMQRQKETFLAGTSPPDFPQTNSEINWTNRATIDDLDDLGELVMQI